MAILGGRARQNHISTSLICKKNRSKSMKAPEKNSAPRSMETLKRTNGNALHPTLPPLPPPPNKQTPYNEIERALVDLLFLDNNTDLSSWLQPKKQENVHLSYETVPQKSDTDNLSIRNKQQHSSLVIDGIPENKSQLIVAGGREIIGPCSSSRSCNEQQPKGNPLIKALCYCTLFDTNCSLWC